MTASHTTTEFYVVEAAATPPPFRMIAGRRAGEARGDRDGPSGDRFLIHTNDRGRNFRLVEAPLPLRARRTRREVVPHRDDVMLEAALDAVVLCEHAGGLPRFRSLRDGSAGVSAVFDEPTYTAFHTTTVSTQRRRSATRISRS